MITAICLGEVLFDLLADQVGAAATEVTSWTALAGGAPANVACGLVKLGDRAKFIGCVGQDEPGQQLAHKLQTAGVDISGLQYHPAAPTRQVQVIRSADGDRQFGGFGQINTTEFADAQIGSISSELFAGADYLLLGTLALAYPASTAATWQAVEFATAHQLKIVVDINWRPTFWADPAAALPQIRSLADRADYVKFAKEEAELLYGVTNPSTLQTKLPQAQGIVVTDGGNDCAYWLRGTLGMQSSFAVAVVDTTGAGDAFVAGLIHGLATDQTGAEIIRYAAAAGALTTLRAGAIDAQPTHQQIMEFLATHL
jgi:fructokinase